MDDMSVRPSTRPLTTPPTTTPPTTAPANGDPPPTTATPQRAGTTPLRDSRSFARPAGTATLSLPTAGTTTGNTPQGPTAATNAMPTAMQTPGAMENLGHQLGDLVQHATDNLKVAKGLVDRVVKSHDIVRAAENGLWKKAPTASTTSTTPPANEPAATPAATENPGATPAKAPPSNFRQGMSVAGGVLGAVGLYTNGKKLVDGIKEGDLSKVASSALGLAGSALQVTSGIKASAELAAKALPATMTEASTLTKGLTAVSENLSGIAKIAGKAGPLLGVAGGLLQAGTAAAKGDVGSTASGLATAAGSALLLAPVPGAQLVGVALIAGAAVYDNWGTIKGWFGAK